MLAVDKRFTEKEMERLRKRGALATREYKVMRYGRAVLIPLRVPVESLIGDAIICHCEPRKKSETRLEGFSSYTLVGDIAIVSYDERVRGREREIAEYIMSIHPRVKTVYAKISTVGEERVAKLIHLYGEKRTKTLYKEHGLTFSVDIQRAYINPRLSTEHIRVANQVNGFVLDMFAGIGGFTLHISARGKAEIVVANDINTAAIQLMLESISMNKRKLKTPILVLNLDAAKLPSILKNSFDHIIMNLPHLAIKFLGTALRLTKHYTYLHVYTIDLTHMEALKSVEKALNSILKNGLCSIAFRDVIRVLDYAPRRYIFRVCILADCIDYNCNTMRKHTRTAPSQGSPRT